jgi:hypothetical protein
VGNILGGKNILKGVGFEDVLGFYTLKEVNTDDVKAWMVEIGNAI